MKTGLDVGDDSIRARQKEPDTFDQDSFRTISLTGGGEAISQINVRERASSLVPFKARILAAVPGKSLNNRIYTKELLQQSAPLYDGKPFILDHDIEHAERVVGIFSHPRYAIERGMDNEGYEGLWLDAVGLMDEDLFDKVKGRGLVPPLVRGFSIGGGGEGDFQADGGVLLKKFIPAEGSITAFPGIPAAHIAAINQVREHYLKPVQNHEVKRTSIPVKETNVSLEEAEKQAAKVKEGPLPPADNAQSTRSLRGASWAQNDTRPGLPAPTVRKDLLHVWPQATTSADTGVKLDGSLAGPGSVPALAKGSKGFSTEQVPGTAGRGAKGSKDAKPFKPKTPDLGTTTTKTPGFGKLSPSGTGIGDQPEEEEEEEEESRKTRAKEDMTVGDGGAPPLARGTSKSPTSRDYPSISGKVTAPGDYPDDIKQLVNPVSRPSEERRSKEQEEGEEEEDEEEEDEEESHKVRIRQDDEPVGGDKSKNPFHPNPDKDEDEEEEEEHGPSPHMPGKPMGKMGGHAAKNAYDSPADTPGEEEEMENPLLKTAGQGQNVGANPIRSGGEEEEEEEEDEEEERAIPPDTIPIQAKAFSLPPDTGVLQSIRRLIEPKHTGEEEALAMIRAWNEGKTPKEPKFQKLSIHKTRPSYGVAGDSSIAHVAKPAPVTRESAIKTKSITNIAPTWAASSVTTLSTRAAEILEQVRRKPVLPNRATETFRRMLPEILDIR